MKSTIFGIRGLTYLCFTLEFLIVLRALARNVKQITLGGCISAWACLLWWSKGNIQNSADVYYDFRKYVVILTMYQFTSK